MTHLLTCRIGRHDFAVPIASIQQIVKTPAMSAVAHPSSSVTGVFSLRGRLVACLNPGLDDNACAFCIVVQQDNDLYALPVCAIGDIVTVTTPLQAVPLTYEASVRRLAPHIVHDRDRIMNVIDIASLLSPEKERYVS